LLGKPNFNKFEKDFGSKFKAATGRMASVAKKALAVVAVAIAAGVAAATKIFTGFATIEGARGVIEFRVGEDNIEDTLKRIDDIREKTGNLVSELDALNAINIGANMTGDIDFVIDNFETVIKLSKVLGKDVDEVQRAFSTFIKTGANLDELVAFEFFKVEEIDALKKASTDFSQQGLETRKSLLSGKISKGEEKLDVNFAKVLKRSQATLDRLSTVTEDTVVVLGEKLNPGINKAAQEITGVIDKFKKDIESGESVGEALLKFVKFVSGFSGELDFDEAGNIIKKKDEKEKDDKGFFGIKQGFLRNIFGDPNAGLLGAAVGSTKQSQVNTTNKQGDTTNNTTFNITEAKNPEETARAVESKMASRIIKNSQRRETPQALNTTVQPAVSK
jgi:hypothetical protein